MGVTKLNPGLLGHNIEMKAEKNPDHTVIIFENDKYAEEPLTYKDIWEGSQKMAAALMEQGLGYGDKVGIMMRNHPEFLYAMVMASLTGMVLVPIDPRTKGEKLTYMLNNSESKAILASSDLTANIEKILPGSQQVTGLFTIDKEGLEKTGDKDHISLTEILRGSLPNRIDNQVSDGGHPFQIIYTSGTTGDPKGVLCENARTMAYGTLANLVFGYKPGHVVYTGLSLTHGNAQAVTLVPALFLELTGIISQKFTKSRLWDIARKYNVTTFSLLGGMAAGIYNVPRKDNDADNPVQYVCSAGMPRAIWADFEKRFDLNILEWYAAVEGGLAYKPIGKGPQGSFGKAFGGLDMKVVDDDDNEVAAGVTGELVSRPGGGGKAKVEYYGNKEASDAKVRGGWLRSGDMVHKDEDGWLFFDYRKGGGLRHNGDFVNPDFVEKVIGEDDTISEAFVYGVPAASGAPGEVDVVAAITGYYGKDPDPAYIYKVCKEGLEPNFIPSYLQVVDEIPKTISEKPQKRFLEEKFAPDAEGVFKYEDYR